VSASSAPERRFHPLAVVRAHDETPRLRALTLEGDAEVAASYRVPGQYVVVRAGGGQAFMALTDAPGGPALSLLVNDVGPVATAARALEPGDRLEATAAEGAGFALERTIGRPLLLVAARTGIAPLRAVIRDHLRRPGRWPNVVLVWGAQTSDEFPYRGEWAEWEAGGVRVVPVVSRGGAGDAGLARGRVQDVLSGAEAGALGGPAAELAVLLAGMPEMVRGCREILIRLGVAPERILVNH
jgi:NAD(P)H-flavin reductase